MLFFVLKTLHVLGALLFLGVGMGSAWYKLRADASGDLRVVVWAQREIVLADWLFTVPSALILPITGLWMANLFGMPWTEGWVGLGLLGFVCAGLLWLPAVALQYRMRTLAEAALEQGTELGPDFARARLAWLALGFPAFIIAAGTIWVMVAKWSPAFMG
ncbi:MAG: DUF2269 domain-containing protein [Proteobacteria bacterium]|nr:DUF2269 domain-containing protein [Pseudomonadota bacterium]